MADASGEEKKTFVEKFSTGCLNFRVFLYNKETGRVMGRSGKSWARIGLFYLIFYGFLAAFFSAMLAVFLSTVNSPKDGGPKLTQFIKNQPGLSRLDHKKKFLEHIDPDNNDTLKAYKDFITEKLSIYSDSNIYDGLCTLGKRNSTSKKPCGFDISMLGPCGNANTSYGMAERKPCVFIRINKVYGWIPESDGDYLELRCNKGTVYPNTDDKPPGGFLINGFPYKGNKKHELPVVAVQIEASESKQEIDCRLHGKGIKVSDSYNPVLIYGKIRIKDVFLKGQGK